MINVIRNSIQSYATSVADAFLSVDCLLPHWSTWDVFRLKLGWILAFPLLIVPLAFLGVRCRKRGTDRTEHTSFRAYWVSTLVLLLYLVYPTLVKQLATLCTCTMDINGASYLQLDPSVPCWQGSHLVWVCSAGVAGTLVYIVGLPWAGFRALRSVDDLSDHTAHLQYGMRGFRR